MEKERHNAQLICQPLYEIRVEGLQKAYNLPFLVHILFRIYWLFWNFDEEFQNPHTFQMPYVYSTYRLQNVETDYKRICELPILKDFLSRIYSDLG